MFKNLSVKFKLYVSIIIGIIITVSGIATFSISKSKKEINKSFENSLIAEVNTIQKLFEREHTLKLQKVENDLKVAHHLFYELGFESKNKFNTTSIVNQLNSDTTDAKIQEWYLNGKSLLIDHFFVDQCLDLFGGTATVFQRSENGFVRISTNVPKLNGERALNTFIPNESPVIKTLLNGETFYGRAYVVNDWYITAYEPIISKNEVIGALYVGSNEKNLQEIRKVLKDFTIGKSGYVFAFDQDFELILHPEMANSDPEDQELLKTLATTNESFIRYTNSKGEHRIYAKTFFEPFQLNIIASIDERIEIAKLINGIILNALLICVIAIVIFSIFVYYITNEHLHNFLEQLESSNKQLASTKLELQHTDKQFREFFNNSSDEIFVIDLNGYILEVNQICCDSLGYDYDELIGVHFSKIKSPKFIGQVSKNIKINKQQGQHLYESEHIHKDGTVIPVEMKSRLIEYRERKAILTIARDITERKEVEDKILRTIISTEEKERMRFAADLHDNLAPILSTIKLYTDLIIKGEMKNINQGEAIKNIDELVDMSLRSAKEISNNIRPNILQDFGLAAAVTEFCKYLKETKQMNIALATDNYKIEKRGIEESILYQAVKELINNTIKHANASKINIDLKSFDDHIILYYRDNGKGFDIKQASTSKSGLGLYNIFNKIKSINGTYDMHSEEDKGMFILISLKLRNK